MLSSQLSIRAHTGQPPGPACIQVVGGHPQGWMAKAGYNLPEVRSREEGWHPRLSLLWEGASCSLCVVPGGMCEPGDVVAGQTRLAATWGVSGHSTKPHLHKAGPHHSDYFNVKLWELNKTWAVWEFKGEVTLSQLALRKQQKEQKSLPRALRFVCTYSYCVHTTCHVARSMKLSFFFFFFPEKVSYYPSHQHGFKSGLNMDLN